MANVLELHGITKRFPGVLANDHIDIVLREGDILALLGENLLHRIWDGFNYISA